MLCIYHILHISHISYSFLCILHILHIYGYIYEYIHIHGIQTPTPHLRTGKTSVWGVLRGSEPYSPPISFLCLLDLVLRTGNISVIQDINQRQTNCSLSSILEIFYFFFSSEKSIFAGFLVRSGTQAPFVFSRSCYKLSDIIHHCCSSRANRNKNLGCLLKCFSAV